MLLACLPRRRDIDLEVPLLEKRMARRANVSHNNRLDDPGPGGDTRRHLEAADNLLVVIWALDLG